MLLPNDGKEVSEVLGAALPTTLPLLDTSEGEALTDDGRNSDGKSRLTGATGDPNTDGIDEGIKLGVEDGSMDGTLLGIKDGNEEPDGASTDSNDKLGTPEGLSEGTKLGMIDGLLDGGLLGISESNNVDNIDGT
jgi:hypothetical protein